jgi:cytochrome c
LNTVENEGEENVRKHDVRGELKTRAVRNGSALMAAFALACLTGAAARADGDSAKGKAAFVRQCAICHTVEKDGDNRMGPNLFGIVGKKAGVAPGFAYTNAFKTRANWEWSEDAIGGWMMFPSTMVPGTAMGAFQGIAEKDRDDLVAYLATLK